MTLKELLDTTNDFDQVRISTQNKTHDDLVTIFKGTALDALHYFYGVDKALNSKVGFIITHVDPKTNAPFMRIVIC